MATTRYFKGLDGFRALAVIMVMMVHSRWLPFGWVGVQMFFVLSGFLITGILLAQKEASFGRYIGRFYWKRSLRIWPLYLFFIALCAIGYAIFGVPETFRTHWLILVTYTYNFASISPTFVDSDYFGHFWTLCIEEQFYLVWPFAIYFLSERHFRWLVISLILGGPLIRYFTGLGFGSELSTAMQIAKGVHRMPTSHLDAFACGAFLALLSRGQRKYFAPKARQIFLLIGTVTISCGLLNSYFLTRRGLPGHWGAFGYDNLAYLHQFVWAYSLLNLTSAALVFCLIEEQLWPQLFQHPLAIYLGVISYGIYVWHLPLLSLIFTHWPCSPHSPQGILRFVTLFAVTVLVSSLSYFGFERFFLRMKKIDSVTTAANRGQP